MTGTGAFSDKKDVKSELNTPNRRKKAKSTPF